MTTELAAYFDRIGFEYSPRADGTTLGALCRAHINTIPFENLDVQLGRKTARSQAEIHDKLVSRQRGGWCYEQNVLMGWALDEIGFDVTRLVAGVMREQAGDGQLGNHILACLSGWREKTCWSMSDSGRALLGPMPIMTGARVDAPFEVGLTQVDDGYWRFRESAHSDPFGFDFTTAPADQSVLDAKRIWQETNPASPFVQNLVVRRRDGVLHHTLRGKVLTTTTIVGLDSRELATADELVDVLDDVFGIDMPEAASLWPAITERHEALFPGTSEEKGQVRGRPWPWAAPPTHKTGRKWPSVVRRRRESPRLNWRIRPPFHGLPTPADPGFSRQRTRRCC